MNEILFTDRKAPLRSSVIFCAQMDVLLLINSNGMNVFE